MKTILRLSLFASLLSFPVFVTAADDEATKRDRILYLFEVNGFLKSIDNQVGAMLAQSKRQYSDFPDELWTDGRLDQLFDSYKDDLVEAYVDAAEQALSDEEVIWLVDFLETEQGEKMLRLNQRTQPLYDEAANSVYKPFMEEFTELLMQYAAE